jgi:hypothetical protein
VLLFQEEEFNELYEETDSDTEDVDEILAGDLVEHKARVTDDENEKTDTDIFTKEPEETAQSEESMLRISYSYPRL